MRFIMFIKHPEDYGDELPAGPVEAMAGERIYYDRATVLNQLGVHREPVGYVGRAAMMLNHPVTIARAYARKIARG